MKSIVCITLVICSVAVASFLAPSNIDPAHKFSWSENVGRMNWRDVDGAGSGVVVGLDFLSGMIRFENGGWMSVGHGAGPYTSTKGLNCGS